MVIEKISATITNMPPNWLSRVTSSGQQVSGQPAEIRKLLGEPIPQVVDLGRVAPHIAAMFARNGLLERLRKKLARLSGKKGGKILPARGTIAAVDDDDNIYVGVDFLMQFGNDEDVIAGILAHEWGHMLSDLPRGADWSQHTWEELFAIRRDEEADADGFAGRALFLMGYAPEPMMELLKMLDRKRKDKNLQTHKYHNTATRVEIIRQSYKASERSMETARKMFSGSRMGPKIGKVLGDG